MWRGGYEIGRDWRRFIARRMVRLDPPYLVTIGLTIGLGYASSLVPAFQGTPPKVSTPQLLAHLGYLNAFLGFPWVNPVFWTLAIEFQYYLAAALLMPFIASADRRVRAVVLAALCLSPLLPLSGDFIFQYAPLFAMGMVAFQHRIGLISRTSFLTLVTGISAFCLVRMSPVVLLAGLGTAYCVGLLKVAVPRWLAFAGLISYSVYLIHVPIGGRVINLGTRLGPSMPTKIGVILAAMSVTTACGYLMYRLVELPAQRWSKRIVYLRSSGKQALRILHGVDSSSPARRDFVDRGPCEVEEPETLRRETRLAVARAGPRLRPRCPGHSPGR